MTFIYFITSIGGLLELWNNISIYDLQLILMKISTKIINSKVMKKLWMLLNSTKISKLLKWIRIFVTKFNFKVSLIIVTAIVLTIQIISYTKDFLTFESHFEIKIQDPLYESMRLPSFRLCFNEINISSSEINEQKIKLNKSDEDFSFGSLLLERRNLIAKQFIESELKF
jgi:hypothetical protein